MHSMESTASAHEDRAKLKFVFSDPGHSEVLFKPNRRTVAQEDCLVDVELARTRRKKEEQPPHENQWLYSHDK